MKNFLLKGNSAAPAKLFAPDSNLDCHGRFCSSLGYPATAVKAVKHYFLYTQK